MSTQVQYRRGTATQNNAFIGALAEITVDTTNWTLRVHDGATAGGGGNLATQSYVDAQIGNIQANAISFTTTSMSIPSGGGNIIANVGGTVTMTVASSAVGIGTAPTDAQLTVAGNKSASSWTTGGIALRLTGATYTDSSTTTSGTATSNHINAVGQSTLAATNGAVTTTDSATVYIAGAPVAGSNMTITNPYALFVDAGASRFDGNILVGSNILNNQSNGVGNIGSSSTYFDTVFAKATSAQYADVAERYLADADYPVGTVLIIGGNKEVTQSTSAGQTSIAGTVSENPGVLMNRGLEGEHVAAVALLGRVPCRVVGTINKGDLLMSSNIPGVACKMTNYAPGCVIGKALENHTVDTQGTIEIMVGRL